MVTTYPHQGELSMVEYHTKFLDFLQLRAVVMDIGATLDSPKEMDIFIRNTKYHVFLRRVMRNECTSASLAYKYTSEQILETLETFLRAADSPATVSTYQNVARLALSTSRTVLPPAHTIDANAFSDTVQELLTLDVPDDPESTRVHSLYARALYAIQASTNHNAPANCIVCGGIHRFDGCDVLKNTEFLRGHYIQYCQQVR